MTRSLRTDSPRLLSRLRRAPRSRALRRGMAQGLESLETRILLSADAQLLGEAGGAAVAPFPTPLAPLAPLGSLAYGGTVAGTLAAGESHQYTITLDADSSLSALLRPAGTLQASVEVFDPNSVSLGSSLAAAVGSNVILPSRPVVSAGTYSVVVSSQAGTAGAFDLDLLLGGVVEEETYGGTDNGDPALGGQDLESSFVLDPNGLTAHTLVSGQADGGLGQTDTFGYGATGVPFQFEDIRATGGTVLTGDDDSSTILSAAQLGGFTFPFYGTTYANVGVSSNALITFPSDDASLSNSDLTTSPSLAAIAVLWDDIDLGDGGTNTSLYWEVRGSGADQRLILQWHEAQYFPYTAGNDPITFQAILYEATGNILLNYLDITSVSEPGQSDGASATAGIKDAGDQTVTGRRLVLMQDNGPNESVGTGVSTLIGVGVGSGGSDYYTFDLEDGQTASLALAAPGPGSYRLELYDSELNLLAMGLPADGNGVSIQNFVDLTAEGDVETYYARVIGPAQPYQLAIGKGAVVDQEPNDASGEEQQLAPSPTALGHLDPALDVYVFQAVAGDVVQVSASAPGGGPGEPVNDLDPQIEVFFVADGTLVASGSAPGSESFGFTAGATGSYGLRVLSQNGQAGDYLLSVTGATGALPPFTVASVVPADGAQLSSQLTEATVTFNDHVLLSTIEAGDLRVDGQQATDFQALDGRTLRFLVPAVGRGVHTLSIADDTIFDIQGTPLAAFSSTFSLDDVGPRVLATSVFNEDELPAGNLVYTAVFDEPITIDPGAVRLFGQFTGDHFPDTVAFDENTLTLTAEFSGLLEDTYTLALSGGDTFFASIRDLVGNLLDGEPEPNTLVPSGDGVRGGDFFIEFTTDVSETAYPAPLDRLAPLGGLIFDPPVTGFVASLADTDTYTLELEAGATLALVAEAQGALRPRIELIDAGGNAVAADDAAVAGGRAAIRAQSLAGGLYRLRVGQAGNTAGQYTLSAIVNADLEDEAYEGATNNDLDSAQDLAPAFLPDAPLGGGRVGRAAVVGVADGGPRYQSLQTQTDNVEFPNVLTFTFTDLPAPQGGGILTLSVIADLDATEEFLNVAVDGVNLGDFFVNDGNQYPATPDVTQITLSLAQLQQFTLNGSLTVTVTPSDQVDDFGTNSLSVELSYQVGVSTQDYYRLSEPEGALLTVALAGPASGDLSVDLLDGAGQVLSASRAVGTNVQAVLDNFRVPAAGDYFLRISGGRVRYSLVVVERGSFEVEGNDALETAQDVTSSGAVLGYVGDAEIDYYALQVNAGDNLLFETFTPFDAAGEPFNALDPRIEIYLPGGGSLTQVADGAADGRNVRFEHQATESGTYVLGLFSEQGTFGDYLLAVSGATGLPAAPTVVAVDPADGGSVAGVPPAVTLTFSQSILYSSLQPEDVTIGGLPALAVAVLAGNVFAFTPDPAAFTGNGAYTVALAGNVVSGVQGRGNDPFTSSFDVDLRGPRIVSTSWNGAPLPADRTIFASQLNVAFTFDEDLAHFLDPYVPPLTTLTESISGASVNLNTLSYDVPNRTLLVGFGGLTEGEFTLTLYSNDGLEDSVGNDLDGEPLGPGADHTPSGNGMAGGNYVVQFTVDAAARPANAFGRLEPAGSLIFESAGNVASINNAADSDQFDFYLEAGETIAAVVRPTNLNAVLTAELVGLSPAVTAVGPGRSIVLPPTAVSAAGAQALRVSGSAAGLYTVELVRNAALEAQVGDSFDGNEVDLDPSRLDLGSGRRAAVGSTQTPVILQRGSAWRFLDDGSDQGTAWRASDFDDSTWQIGPAQLGFGDGDEVTVVRELNDQGNRIRTYYFRREIEISSLAGLSFIVAKMLRDDGAVVYVNGAEAFRSNMPAGTISFQSLASSGVNNEAESAYNATAMPTSFFTVGRNVIAVEVHQVNDTSTDISFDLELEASGGEEVLVPMGSVWKYLDNGSNQGTAWQAPNFDDSTWRSGPAQLGYGDGDEATTVSFGPQASNKFVTTYFRREFTVENPNELSTLALDFVRDDGIVVYLNGNEVARNNLPGYGTIPPNQMPFNQFANNTIGGASESVVITAAVDASRLVAGRNVLAVEIHQDSPDSSDISFDLRLRGTLPLPETDDYEVTLTAGQVIDVILAGQGGADFRGAPVSLIDSLGRTLVVGGNAPLGIPVTNYDRAINDFLVPTSGVYTVRVGAGSGGRYALTVLDELVFDTEPNEAGRPLRTIPVGGAALGYLEPGGGFAYADPVGDTVFNGLHDLVSTQAAIVGDALELTAAFNDTVALPSQGGPRVLQGFFALDLDQDPLTGIPNPQGQYSPAHSGGPLGAEVFVVLFSEVSNPGIITLQDPISGAFLGEGTVRVEGNSIVISILLSTLGDDGVVNYATVWGYSGGPTDVGPNSEVGTSGNATNATDRYRVSLPGGTIALLTTDTPLDDPAHSPGNTLIPSLSVFDSAGNPVALGTGLLPDGKNLRAGFVVPASEVFTLELGAGSGFGEYLLDVQALPASHVVGRHIFYNHSAYDGDDPAASGADDAAIAPDKSALLPGGVASFANYTSYSRGINGVMVDLDVVPGAALDAADFEFRVGNNNAPETWTAPAVAPEVSLRRGAGVGGSDRVTLIWPDGAVQKQWLQVTVLANLDTGLATPDVFYFGNAVGEAGNRTTDAIVSAVDQLLARVNPRSAMNPAPIDFRFDYNRDTLVDATDQIISRVNQTTPLTGLRLIAPPAALAPLGEAAAGLAAGDLLVDGEWVDALAAARRKRG